MIFHTFHEDEKSNYISINTPLQNLPFFFKVIQTNFLYQFFLILEQFLHLYKYPTCSKTHPFFKKVIQTKFLLLFKLILSNFFSNNSHISINILLVRSKRFYFFKKVIQTRFLLSNSL